MSNFLCQNVQTTEEGGQGVQFTFQRGGGNGPPLRGGTQWAGFGQVGGECREKHHDNRIE